MSDESQKRIFAKNLNYYISFNGKLQNEVAKNTGKNPVCENVELMGHSDLKIIMEEYAHLDEEKEAVQEKLNNAIAL